jgi:transglutaminase-like putative cysteine protease
MVLIFFLFPRFSTGFGSGTDTPGRTGISSELRPGSVSGLITSDRLVFRATFLNDVPPRQDLYWRGAVLDVSEGLNWSRGRSGFGRKPPPAVRSPDVEIYLEPGYGRFLFSLDTTVGLTFPNDLTGSTLQQWSGRIYQLNQVLQTRGRYYLYNADTLPDENTDPQLDLATEDKPSARMEQFLRPLRGKREVEVVSELLQNFRQNGYRYSLQPPPAQSIDQFFFETKTGFCEHYAAAMATILRYLKIPSRVVVGFQGGTVSFLDNYVTVREHDAHAWLEYYNRTSHKWHRVDPTMQVAIERINLGSEVYIQHGEGFLPNWVPANWALPYLKARAFFDEMDASWISFLLHFDMAQQREWLKKLGMEEVMFRALPVFLILALTLTLALLYFFESHRPERLSAEERLYRQFLKQTKRWRFEKTASEGLATWLQRLERSHVKLALAARPAVERLIRLRFGSASVSGEDLKEIRSQLKDLKKLSIKA